MHLDDLVNQILSKQNEDFKPGLPLILPDDLFLLFIYHSVESKNHVWLPLASGNVVCPTRQHLLPVATADKHAPSCPPFQP